MLDWSPGKNRLWQGMPGGMKRMNKACFLHVLFDVFVISERKKRKLGRPFFTKIFNNFNPQLLIISSNYAERPSGCGGCRFYRRMHFHTATSCQMPCTEYATSHLYTYFLYMHELLGKHCITALSRA